MRANIHTQVSTERGASPMTDASATMAAVPGGSARAAVQAALLASVSNLAIYALAWALWHVPAGFNALNPASIAVSSMVGTMAAAAGYQVLSKLSSRPGPLFIASTAILTLLSLAGPIQAMTGAMPGQTAATTATGLSMMLMHLVTGGIIVRLLPGTARR